MVQMRAAVETSKLSFKAQDMMQEYLASNLSFADD